MKISEEFDRIVALAREEAMRTGSYSIGADHLFLAILRHRDNEALAVLDKKGLDLPEAKREIDSLIFHEHSIPFAEQDDIRLGRDGSSTVNLAIAEAMADGSSEAGSVHLLKAIFKQEESAAGRLLRRFGIALSDIGPEGKKPSGRPTEAAYPSAELMGKLLSSFKVNNKIFS